MNANIRVGDEFKRQFKRLAKKYRSLLTDFEAFVQALEDNPQQGVDLGHGVRKVRMPITSKSKGKSGGARIITYNELVAVDFVEITLLTIYDKNEMDNVSDDYIKSLIPQL